MLFACVLLLALVAVLVILLIRFWNRETNYRNQLQRYSGIADLDAAIETAKSQLEEAKQGVRATAEEDKRRREQLETQYKQALTKFEELKHEVSLLEENLDVMSFGLYKPHFTFQTSEEYKDALIALRNKMKDVTTSGGAATCPVGWTVNDSKQEGAKMIRQTTKVMLRAF